MEYIIVGLVPSEHKKIWEGSKAGTLTPKGVTDLIAKGYISGECISPSRINPTPRDRPRAFLYKNDQETRTNPGPSKKEGVEKC